MQGGPISTQLTKWPEILSVQTSFTSILYMDAKKLFFFFLKGLLIDWLIDRFEREAWREWGEAEGETESSSRHRPMCSVL